VVQFNTQMKYGSNKGPKNVDKIITFSEYKNSSLNSVVSA